MKGGRVRDSTNAHCHISTACLDGYTIHPAALTFIWHDLFYLQMSDCTYLVICFTRGLSCHSKVTVIEMWQYYLKGDGGGGAPMTVHDIKLSYV